MTNKSEALQSFRWRQGYCRPPWGIDLLLTDACNLRCSYCPIWGEDSKLPAPAAFMDTSAALRFLDGVAPFRPMIRLFGGEPFIHPEWRRVVDHARGHGLHCTAVSNGMRLIKEPEEIVRSGLLAIGISLDTDGAVNDALRGRGTLDSCRSGTAHVSGRSGASSARTSACRSATGARTAASGGLRGRAATGRSRAGSAGRPR